SALGQLRISSWPGPNYAYLHGRHRVESRSSTASRGSSPQPSSDCRPKLMKDFGGAEILYRACLSWVKGIKLAVSICSPNSLRYRTLSEALAVPNRPAKEHQMGP